MSDEGLIQRKFQYARAKAKLAEFSVPAAEYPDFKYDSDDLCFNAMNVLSSFTDTLIEGRQPDKELLNRMRKAASFYDAASNSAEHAAYSDGFWTLAMSTYFLEKNFGSALVASDHIGNSTWYGPMAARFYLLVRFLLKGEAPKEEMGLPKFVAYIQGGDGSREDVKGEAVLLLNDANAESYIFGKVCYVAIGIAMQFASRRLLPEFSGIGSGHWKDYLSSNDACRILWQAQERIGRKGAFGGKNLFVQLPTGSGKTQSIQLLIRSRIIAGGCGRAVVVAPLRALCSEIARDLTRSISDVAEVRQSTETLELDEWLGLENSKPQVLVFTPEKFAYVERHSEELIVSTDLFILDEAHLIDDPSRGPAYELMIAEVKQKNPGAQLVMLSAVVTNPDEIAKWAMDDSKSYVSGDGIPRTDKSLGVIDQTHRRVSFWEMPANGMPEYFVPLPLDVQELPALQGEKKARHFPACNKEDGNAIVSRELAIYLAEKVIPNGPVAIYLPKSIYISGFFTRLNELHAHACQLPNLSERRNEGAAGKIYSLVKLHYGQDWADIIEGGMAFDMLPHYGSLQGCLRQVVEDEIDCGHFSCVVCTSTLAQGVNLPIKYLIITGVRNGVSSIKTRDFQNLLGRAARSGKFSEGSILVSDQALFKTHTYKDYNRLFDETRSEACTSAITKLLEDLPIEKTIRGNRKVLLETLSGDEVVNLVLENLAKRDVGTGIVEYITRTYNLETKDARQCVSDRLTALNAIETYISGMLERSPDDVDAVSLCTSTFAYSRANDAGQELLMKLFKAICETLQMPETPLPLAVYSKTQMGIAKTEALLNWLRSDDGRSLIEAREDADKILPICKAYRHCIGNDDDWLDAGQLAFLTKMWMNGDAIDQMVARLKSEYEFPPKKGPNISRVEKALSYDVSYGLANFISCVADLLGPNSEILASDDLSSSLSSLHEKIKFGVSTSLGCSVCREIFPDRMVANGLVRIIGVASRDSNEALAMLARLHQDKIKQYLSDLPEYFTKRFESWLCHNG